MIPLNDYQQKIFNVLKENMKDIKVYDDVPKSAKLPLIVVGDYMLSNGLIKSNSYKIVQAIDIYSKYEGKKEINELVSQAVCSIAKVFNKDINTEWCVTSLVLLESEIARVEDIYVANLKFEIEIEEIN